ncbi:BZ3500_MvSof-1268-A1-R1_Chr4-4g07518 [Microbotryum saponariae]|uniref:BZ3500_MvSof-1268-A1-R1_Chr4-4g07518 protein n=1 Tax=Microbotryum saponariae TaxID=289078 RepID=A0A2X0KS14_9BASI|nr:BZ3500_MvSof-1268-A1-R1_Chr4-4g07518 [Microbotryum saponariae]SDA07179.1 BZ3501_MvSof-1269-A2-R1_Chr4-3g07226 [Microbotryum saponariae]
MKGVRCIQGGASVPLGDRREPLKQLNLQNGARNPTTKTKRGKERWIEIGRKNVQVSSSCHEVFAASPLPRTKSDRQPGAGSALELPTSRAAVQTESSQVPTKRTTQSTPSNHDMNPSSPIEPGWILDASGEVVKVSPDWEEEPPDCEWAMRKGPADDVVARCRQLGTRELSSASPPLSPITLHEAKWEAMRRDVPSNRSIQITLVNDLLLGAVARGLELNRMTRKRSVDAIKGTQDQPSANLVRPAETSKPPARPTCTTCTGPADPTIEGPNNLPLPRTPHLEPPPLAELPFIPRSPNIPSTLFLNPREYYLPYLERPEQTKLQLLQRAYATSSSLNPKKLLFDWGEGRKGRGRGRGENLPRVWGNAPEMESLVAWVGSGIGPG